MRAALLLALFVACAPGWARASGPQRALVGVSRADFVADVNVGEPEKLVLRLELLDRTYRQLRDVGVEVRGWWPFGVRRAVS